jgi:paraquat-inducible protein B
MRHGWWPGWIWGIPVAAVLVVAWLGLRSLMSGSETITISFDDVHGLKEKNTNVEYRGTNVGHVKKIELSKAGDRVDVTASIDKSATKFLRSGTRFWLRGANPSLSNLQSLASVLSGPTIVMEPGPGKGSKTKHFVGTAEKPVEPAQNAPAVLYGVALSGEAGSVKPGDPVKLNGFTVGEVRDIGFEFNTKTDEVEIPCTLALYPSLFRVDNGGAAPSPEGVRAEIGALIQKGLRARLDRDPPLVGQYRVNLDMTSTGPPAGETTAQVGSLPQIPFASGGGLESIAARVNKIPIEQITHNILDITHHIDTIVASPQLKAAIGELDAALKQIHQTTAQAGPQVTRLLTTLHKASDDLDQTANSADRFVTGSATQDGLNSVTAEVTEAARAVRSLADYLDRHPEALLKGKGEAE